ncbi:MAG: DUF6516 family protein [Thermodesulfobacteriota bacterium]
MYAQLAELALAEHGDIIIRAEPRARRAGVPLKVRLFVIDGTMIDVWLSPDRKRYSYHWEQRARRGLLFRHDNAPDHPHLATFPRHFHDGSDAEVKESHLPNDPLLALREFLDFVRKKLRGYEQG